MQEQKQSQHSSRNSQIEEKETGEALQAGFTRKRGTCWMGKSGNGRSGYRGENDLRHEPAYSLGGVVAPIGGRVNKV